MEHTRCLGLRVEDLRDGRQPQWNTAALLVPRPQSRADSRRRVGTRFVLFVDPFICNAGGLFEEVIHVPAFGSPCLRHLVQEIFWGKSHGGVVLRVYDAADLNVDLGVGTLKSDE